MPDLTRDIPIEITRKRVKYLRIRVCPPEGQVRVSAPHRMPMGTIRQFLRDKADWIEQQQARIRARRPAPAKTYTQGELHPFMGHNYPLCIQESHQKPHVALTQAGIQLSLRPNTGRDKRREVLETWYRQQLKARIPELIRLYEPRMGVQVKEFNVKRMKTRWGSCNTRAKRIWLSLELAKKPPECLEYVVVHEMVHLLEASHNARFKALMSEFLPDWRERKGHLNKTKGK